MNTPRDAQLDDETLGHCVLNGMSSLPLPHSSGVYDEEEADDEEVVDDSKVTVSSRHNGADAHLNSVQRMPDLRRSRQI